MNGKYGSDTGKDSDLNRHAEPSRREFLAALSSAALLSALPAPKLYAQDGEGPLNIARVAVPTSQMVTSQDKISSLNDGFTPANSFDRAHKLYALWVEGPQEGNSRWVQYEWSEPVSVNKVEIYWAVDRPRAGAIAGQLRPADVCAEELSDSLLEW